MPCRQLLLTSWMLDWPKDTSMEKRSYTLTILAVLVLGILPSFTPTVFAARWTCPDTGSTFSTQSICASQCSVGCACAGSDCSGASGNNPFATDQTPYPHGVVPVIPDDSPIRDVNDALGILVSVIELAQVVFWILTVGFGLYGAYLYLFATGSKESAAQARRVFIYTAIAALLGIIAYGLPGIIEGFVFGF